MRLIDADELRRAMYHEAFEKDTDLQKWDSGCWIRYKVFENKIEEAPTVDAVEQKHGHWEISAYCNHKPYRIRHAGKWTIWKCSVCGENNGRCHSDAYCRHCGAKMDEVTE